MKVALVHDDLIQWGGAERVLSALSELFPDAPIFTSVYDRHNKIIKKNFGRKKIITSFIQKIPGWKFLYKALLPLYPIAFEQFDFSGFDVVISQTTRFAKSIITRPETCHICYCHTPPRFLWGFTEEKSLALISPYTAFLKKYDVLSSKRVDIWVAGSSNAQKRIEEIYGAHSQVIYPFVELERFEGVENFDGGYLLVISRLNAYKRVDLVVRAANRLKIPLKIVGIGPKRNYLENIAGSTVEFLDFIDDELLVRVIAGCKTLVVAGKEDFGLVALEAQALGKPILAFGAGGALETVIDGQTGYLFQEQTIESIIEALNKLYKRGYNEKRCKIQAQQFSKQKFKEQFRKLVFSLRCTTS